MTCFGPLGDLLGLFGIIGFIFLLFGGVLWALSSSSKENTKPWMVMSIVGGVLLVLLLIGGILNQMWLPLGCPGRIG
jgi:hypothetical protein